MKSLKKLSETEGPSRRERPPGRWKNRIKEYMSVVYLFFLLIIRS